MTALNRGSAACRIEPLPVVLHDYEQLRRLSLHVQTDAGGPSVPSCVSHELAEDREHKPIPEANRSVVDPDAHRETFAASLVGHERLHGGPKPAMPEHRRMQL